MTDQHAQALEALKLIAGSYDLGLAIDRSEWKTLHDAILAIPQAAPSAEPHLKVTVHEGLRPIPARAVSNPHKGGTQAYFATEHWNEGWNACLDAIGATCSAPLSPEAWKQLGRDELLLEINQEVLDRLSSAAPSAAEPVANCTDPMCACHGGPCAECPEGEREQELADLRSSLDFYRRRVELLQTWQQRMRDPERTIVCDIIANGQTLPDADGSRYGAAPPAPQAVSEPQGRCVRFTEPCECAPEAKLGCITWRPALSNARIMELWRIADHPCDENGHTTGPLPFARLIEKELAASAVGEERNVPFKQGSWERDADGDLSHLCTDCGTPVRYGSRHGHCLDPKTSVPQSTASAPVAEPVALTKDDLMNLVSGVSESRPLGQQWDQIFAALREAHRLGAAHPSPVAEEAEDAALNIGAVLAYTVKPRAGVYGATMGADGSGDFAVVFLGTEAQGADAAALYVRALEQSGARLANAVIMHGDLYAGRAITIVDAAAQCAALSQGGGA